MDENERKLSSPSPPPPLIGQNHATKSALVPTFNAFNRDRMAAKASRPNDASLKLLIFTSQYVKVQKPLSPEVSSYCPLARYPVFR